MRLLPALLLAVLVAVVAIPMPASAQVDNGIVLSGGLASRLRWVNFEIVGGRIVASSVHVGTNMNSSNASNGRREKLSIDLTNNAPNVLYELVDKTIELTLKVTDGEKISIRNVKKSDNGTTSVEFTQTPDSELTLTIEGPEGKRTTAGPTLWHLLLQEPGVTRTLLAPTLDMLKPGWKLANVADAIEESLCQNARTRRTPERDRWTGWVAALASEHFADRQSAERKLMETGREVVPYLRGLDRASLDAEQWRRVRNLIAALDSYQGDSVEQTVSLLAEDPRAWLCLLNRKDDSRRRLALEQLQTITGEKLEFDPAASPETQVKQLEELQHRFAPVPKKVDDEAKD